MGCRFAAGEVLSRRQRGDGVAANRVKSDLHPLAGG